MLGLTEHCCRTQKKSNLSRIKDGYVTFHSILEKIMIYPVTLTVPLPSHYRPIPVPLSFEGRRDRTVPHLPSMLITVPHCL